MRSTILAMSAAALTAAAAAWAAEPTAGQDERGGRKVAAVDTSAAGFRRIDTDRDGRLSAMEAARHPPVAEAFTSADRDGDGYLSEKEFRAMGDDERAPEPADEAGPADDADADDDPRPEHPPESGTDTDTLHGEPRSPSGP